MPVLAGFDLILEIAKDTIVDTVNARRVSLPLNAGEVYLFGGPFVANVPVPLGGGVEALFGVRCDPQFEPVARTDLARIRVSFANGRFSLPGGSVPSGTTVGPLSGELVVTVTLAFRPDSRVGAGPLDFVPTADFPAAAIDPHPLDSRSRRTLDSWHLGTADAVDAALVAWVHQEVATIPIWLDGSTGAGGVKVRFGHDSDDPMTLSAVPQVMWINNRALGVFGYHHKAATGGDLQAKLDDDITAVREEFMFVQDELSSVMPTRRFAVLLSPRGFQLTIACPQIVKEAVRSIVADREHQRFIDVARREDEARFRDEEGRAHFLDFLLEEMKNDETSPQHDWEAARVRVQEKVNEDIERDANTRADSWTRDTFDGQLAVQRAMPPPCGTGEATSKPQDMPNPFSATPYTLDRMEVTLGLSRIGIVAHTHGHIDNVGDFEATVPINMAFSNQNGSIVSKLDRPAPDVQLHFDVELKLALAAIGAVLGGAFWGAVFAFVSVKVGEAVSESLAADAIASRPIPGRAGKGGSAFDRLNELKRQGIGELHDLEISPDGIAIHALIARRFHWNDFRPRVELDVQQTSHEVASRVAAPKRGVLKVPATDYGCGGGSYRWTRAFYDNTYTVKARAIDIVGPLSVQRVTVEVGNPTWLFPHVLDPRPSFDGGVVEAIQPLTTATGRVFHSAPPPDGQFELRDDIKITMSDNETQGWHLGCRAEDGNYWLRVTADMSTIDNVSMTASTILHVSGDETVLPLDYYQDQEACQAKFDAWFQESQRKSAPHVGQHTPPRGSPLESSLGEAWIARHILTENSAAGFELIQDGIRKHGPEFAHLVTSIRTL